MSSPITSLKSEGLLIVWMLSATHQRPSPRLCHVSAGLAAFLLFQAYLERVTVLRDGALFDPSTW
jgi:hypothetical protein